MFGVCAILSSAVAQAQDEPELLDPPEKTEDEGPRAAPAVKEAKPRPSPTGAKLEAVRAVVVTDGAAVYEKPDFDAPVVGYLNFETQVTASRKSYTGQGGLGLFHKVAYQGRSGYIADTDIRISKKGASEAKAKGKKKKKSKSSGEDGKEGGKDPLYFTRYLGIALAQVNFTEKFSGRKLSDKMTMFGARMTGPGTLFDGPPLDFNFWVSVDKPSYYNRFSSATPTGFMFFGDVMMLAPFYDGGDFLVNGGLGIMALYTRYKVPVKNSSFDSQEVRIGAAFDLGVAYRIKRYALRGDLKYYYEKTQYLGYVGSFQTEF